MAYNFNAVLGLKDDITNKIKNISETISSITIPVKDVQKNINSACNTAKSSMDKVKKTTNDVKEETKKASQETKNLGNGYNGLDKSLNKIKTTITAIAGISVIKKIGSDMLENAMQVENAKAKLETFSASAEDAGQQIKKAKDFANSTPFETNDIVDGMVKMKSYSLETTDEMMTRVGNMAGAMGKSYDQAVEAIADAQTGELERLKEFGITKQQIIDQGAKTMAGKELVNAKGQIVDQQAFNTALFQLMDDRYKGGMERQAKTLKGTMSTLNGMKSNILSILGGIDDEGNVIAGGLLDTIKNVVTNINNKLMELNNNGTIQKWGESFRNTFTKVKDSIKMVVNFVVQNKDIILPIIAGIVTALSSIKVFNTIKTGITSLKTAFTLLTSPIGIVTLAIAGVVAGLIYAYQHSEKFRNVVNKVVESVKEKFESLRDKVGACLNTIKTFLEEHQTQVEAVKWFINQVIDYIIDFISSTVQNIGQILGGIIDVISGIIDIISGIFQGDWSKVWDGFKTVVKGAIEMIKGWWKEMTDLFKKPIDFVVNLFKNDQSDTESVSNAGQNATGTNNWRGGLTWVGEKGKELLNIPSGSQIINNSDSMDLVNGRNNNSGQPISINIPKLADSIIVREDADIDKIGKSLFNKIKQQKLVLS